MQFSEAKEIKKKTQKKIQVPQDDSITEGVNSKHPEKRKGIVAIKGGRERKMEKKENIEGQVIWSIWTFSRLSEQILILLIFIHRFGVLI